MSRKLVAGTRGSALALRQVDIVSEALASLHPDVEIERRVIRTEGDRRTEVTLEQIGGQGVFVKDIEARLLAGEIDIAVHSLKDMPAQSADALVIAAVLPRGDVRDVLISRNNASLAELPSGARIGTDSRRRAVQLRAMRDDLVTTSIRGNVDTRIRKVAESEVDAIVLAAAGLERLGLLDQASQVFSPVEMVPAVGQGVLAVQCRLSDKETVDLLYSIDDAPTRSAINAERAYLARLGAGCRLPVAAYATVDGDILHVRGLLASDDGAVHRAELTGSAADAASLGERLAEHLALDANFSLEAATS